MKVARSVRLMLRCSIPKVRGSCPDDDAKGESLSSTEGNTVKVRPGLSKWKELMGFLVILLGSRS